MFVRESSADYHAEWVYRGGAFELAFMIDWTHRWTLNNLRNLAAPADYDRIKGVLEKGIEELDSWRWQLPLYPDPLVVGLDDWYNDFLAHPDDGPFWWQWNIAQRHAQIDAPICHLGGWFDIFLNGTLKNYQGLRTGARTAAAQANQRLIVGPWIHGPLGTAKSLQGEVDFGAEAVWDYNEMRLPWFEYWLKGIENGVMDEPRVKLFVMGENQWRSADAYPLPGTRNTPWYLHEQGALTPAAPAGAEHADSYLYDPADPVPTLGGNTLNIPNGAMTNARSRNVVSSTPANPSARISPSSAPSPACSTPCLRRPTPIGWCV